MSLTFMPRKPSQNKDTERLNVGVLQHARLQIPLTEDQLEGPGFLWPFSSQAGTVGALRCREGVDFCPHHVPAAGPTPDMSKRGIEQKQ